MSALTAHAFDVVICDVRMQKMDGFAVFRRAAPSCLRRT
jgi:CheY-like chemotaxis protein